MRTVAARVRFLITVGGTTLNKAATLMGIPQPSLNSIATGRSKNPRAGHLATIACFYGVPLDWLIGGEGEPTINSAKVANTICAAIDAKAQADKALVRERLGVSDQRARRIARMDTR